MNSLLLLLLLPISVIAQCDSGAVYDSLRNKCYQYYTASVDFETAESICEQSGGHLISVHSMIDNNYFTQQAKQYFYGLVWLGAQSSSQVLTNPTNWKWTDKSSFDYQNYQSGQPSSLGSNACMIFNSATGKWLTSSCINSYPFICSSDPNNSLQTTCAPQRIQNCPSRYSFLEETNSCYKTFVSLKNYTEANEFCKSEGAELASVHSKLENDFLVEISRTSYNSTPKSDNHVYIGLIYQNGWKWTDGSPVDYLNWASGEPNNMDREYWTALMPDPCSSDYNPDGNQWNNIENIEQRAFICKKPAV